MLTELVVQNLVIVQKARICPGRGLTAISGETGAGKSLLLDALELIMGGRAQAKLVGPHGDEVVVSAVFEVSADLAQQISTACGVASADAGQFILRRRIATNGRSQAWINDVPVTVTALQAAASRLIDIRSQHEAQRLNDAARQLAMLDAYAGLTELAASYRAAHHQYLQLEQDLADLRDGSKDSVKELDFLRFQEREFDELTPRPGELAELEQRLALLSGIETWRAHAQRFADQLGEGEHASVRVLAQAARALESAPDEALAQAGRACAAAGELVREAVSACADASDRLVGDQEELDRLEQRRDRWYDLMRKHGDGEQALLLAWQTIKNRIQELVGVDARLEALVKQIAQQQDLRQRLGQELATSRRKGFAALAREVVSELANLGMPKAKLSLSEQDAAPTADGFVAQEFLISANPGMPPGRLGEVVSGGEGARVSLALAAILAEHECIPVLVFDEIDSGVGGRLGATIGAKLAQLARQRTVIVVTHTPQVAAAADRHYLVRKLHGNAKTMVEVTEIADSGRIAELADMLGGGPAAVGQATALMAGAKH